MMNLIDDLLYNFVKRLEPTSFRRKFSCESDLSLQWYFKGILLFMLYMCLILSTLLGSILKHGKIEMILNLSCIVSLALIGLVCFYFLLKIKQIKCDSIGIWVNGKEKIPWNNIQEIIKYSSVFQKIKFGKNGKTRSLYVCTNYDELLSAKYLFKIGIIKTPKTASEKMLELVSRRGMLARYFFR